MVTERFTLATLKEDIIIPKTKYKDTTKSCVKFINPIKEVKHQRRSSEAELTSRMKNL